MKTIYLHGRMGQKFGHKWELDVSSPAEAIHAIECQRKGIFEYLIAGDRRGVAYRVFLNDQLMTSPHELLHVYGDDVTEIHFHPVIRGAGIGEWLGVVLGVVILVAAVVFTGGFGALGSLSAIGGVLGGGGLGGFFATMGLAMIFGGIATMLAGQTKTGSNQDSVASYAFGGAVNTSRQGGPISVGYGELLVGSQVISLAVRTMRIPVNAADGTITWKDLP